MFDFQQRSPKKVSAIQFSVDLKYCDAIALGRCPYLQSTENQISPLFLSHFLFQPFNSNVPPSGVRWGTCGFQIRNRYAGPVRFLSFFTSMHIGTRSNKNLSRCVSLNFTNFFFVFLKRKKKKFEFCIKISKI